MPILDDIQDAVITCCCKGDPEIEGRLWRQAIAEVNIGNRIGKVTSELGHLPLAKDFYEWVERDGWGETLGQEVPLRVSLNKQDDQDQRRSAFLHRLTYLAIPFAKSLDSDIDNAGTLFREQWRLQWRPSIDSALIEKNLYGDTIETATLAQLRETVTNDTGHARRICGQLRRALNMDLPDLIPTIEAVCVHAVARDDRFLSLSDALVHLMVIQRQAIHTHLPLDTLDSLLEACFERACFALPSVMEASDAEHRKIVSALQAVSEYITANYHGQRDCTPLDRTLFMQHLTMAAEHTTVPFLRGVFLGMLVELRDLPPAVIHDQLKAYAEASPECLVEAGRFLAGVLAVSRASILIGADDLVASIDNLLRVAGWEDFLMMLPHLRTAFNALDAPQRTSLAERVAQAYGLAEVESLTELRTSVTASALFARIDRDVEAMMKEWEL